MAASVVEYMPNFAGGGSYIRPQKPQRPRRYVTSKVTRPVPLCEALALCRGLIPDALMNDRFLKRESMRSAQRPSPPGPVSSQGVWY